MSVGKFFDKPFEVAEEDRKYHGSFWFQASARHSFFLSIILCTSFWKAGEVVDVPDDRASSETLH